MTGCGRFKSINGVSLLSCLLGLPPIANMSRLLLDSLLLRYSPTWYLNAKADNRLPLLQAKLVSQ